jgi:hypothetical protein
VPVSSDSATSTSSATLVRRPAPCPDPATNGAYPDPGKQHRDRLPIRPLLARLATQAGCAPAARPC